MSVLLPFMTVILGIVAIFVVYHAIRDFVRWRRRQRKQDQWVKDWLLGRDKK